MIQVKVLRGNGDIEAPPIQDSLIVSDSMAVARGKRFLDDPSQGNYYTTIHRSLSLFPTTIVYPNDWIEIKESRLGITAPLKVTSMRLSISKSDGVWATLDTLEFREPES